MADEAPVRGLSEVQAAAKAGFSRFRDFHRARKLGLFPPPLHELPGVGPIWSSAQIERFLGGVPQRSGREEALRRLRVPAPTPSSSTRHPK